MQKSRIKVLAVAAVVGLIFWMQSRPKPGAPGIEAFEASVVEVADQRAHPPLDKAAPDGSSSEATTHEEVREPASAATSLTLEQVEQVRQMTKGRLASAFTAQAAYFAEYGRYTTDLRSAGWAPPEALMNFKMGFLESYQATSNEGLSNVDERPERMTTDIFLGATGESDVPYYEYDEALKAIDLRAFEKYCEFKCTATATGFEALMLVPLGNSNNVDVWIINGAKEMKLVRDGLKEPLDRP